MTSERAFLNSIIIGSGSMESGSALSAVLSCESCAVICADGGADHARQLAVTPDLLIGDMDSIRPETLQSLEQQGIPIIRKSPEKDETDLELALLEAVEREAQWIRIIGGSGNRLDQTVAGLLLLLLPELKGRDVRLVNGDETSWLARPGEHQLTGHAGDTVSLIPFAGDVTGITTHNLQYPLNSETLYFGPARGISNVMEAEHASVAFESGYLLIVHTTGRA